MKYLPYCGAEYVMHMSKVIAKVNNRLDFIDTISLQLTSKGFSYFCASNIY